MRLEARAAVSRPMQIAAPFAAIAFTLVVVLAARRVGGRAGRRRVLAAARRRGFGSRFAWRETLTRATPLILTGLAVAVAFRAQLYNIGAEGQLYVGRARRGRRRQCGDCRCRPSSLFPLIDARGDGRRRAAAARPGAAQDAVRRRRGGDDAAAQLHRAAVRVDDARRADEGSRRAMGWPQSGRASRRARARQARRAHARAHRTADRARARGAASGRRSRSPTFGFEMRAVGANARAAAFAGVPVHGGRWSRRCSRARSPGSPAASRSPGAPATSRSTCRRATATAASSSRCSRG